MLSQTFLLFSLFAGCSTVPKKLEYGHYSSQLPSRSTLPVIRSIRATTPVIRSVGREVSVTKGKQAYLDCRVDDLQDFVVVWSNGERIISANRMLVRKDGKFRLNEHFGLEILKISEEDGGNYTCQVDVYGDSIKITHTVKVIVPPRIRSVNDSIRAHAGDTVTLTCRAEGQPPPVIVWTQHSSGKELPSIPGSNGVAMLGPVRREDADIYICTATNNFGHETKKMTQVEVLYAPDITVEEYWRHREEGKWDVELHCAVQSNPNSQVAWYKYPKTRLSTDDRHLIEKKGNSLSLLLEGVTEDQFDNYTCEADNSMGKASVTFDLTGRPGAPVITTSVHQMLMPESKELNISWTTDSFAPITAYFLYYRKNQVNSEDLSGKDWNEVAIPVASLPLHTSYTSPGRAYEGFYVIKDVENKVVYDVALKAQNKYGVSKESDIYNFYVQHKESDMSPQQLTHPEINKNFPAPMETLDAASSAQPSFSRAFLAILAPILISSLTILKHL